MAIHCRRNRDLGNGFVAEIFLGRFKGDGHSYKAGHGGKPQEPCWYNILIAFNNFSKGVLIADPEDKEYINKLNGNDHKDQAAKVFKDCRKIIFCIQF